MQVSIRHLNTCDQEEFVRICGPLFERSPWIARRAFSKRPFRSLHHLHDVLCERMYAASPDEQVRLIQSHPDLVGRLARQGRLTRESTSEQSAAGLDRLADHELAQFDRYNAAYREKFGFPFVICARENQKEAILAAFPVRLQHTRDEEIATALEQIAKIAWLRLCDVVVEE